MNKINQIPFTIIIPVFNEFSNIEILGPTPGYPSKMRGRFKWNVVLKGPELRNFFSTIDIPQGWVVDVDPISII